RRNLNTRNYLITKSIHHESFGFFFRDTSLLHIKQSTLIKLTNRTTMRTLHVICKDLELWFGINCRFIANQNIVVLLESIGFLSNLVNINLSVENPCCLPAKNTFVILMAFAIGLGMMY